ncbi:MAG: hypothetical protein IIC22_01820 [Chloroflexi bacterium]|nr:hypothetical protein [Chloroflexota bacterium]
MSPPYFSCAFCIVSGAALLTAAIVGDSITNDFGGLLEPIKGVHSQAGRNQLCISLPDWQEERLFSMVGLFYSRPAQHSFRRMRQAA